MTIRELVTKWGFDIEHEKLTKVEEQLEKIRHRIEFLGAVEIVKGIVELSERFAKFAEDLHVASESAGITIESLQKLGFAAKQSAVEQGELEGALARMSRKLYEARKGNEEANKTFAEAGFTPSQVMGFKTSSDVLLALSDRFKDMHDPIKKQAILMQLAGRGSYNMVGFLNKGSAAIKGMGNQAESLGVVLGHDQIEALIKVEHAFSKVFSIIKAVGATIAAALAPEVTYIVNEMLKFWQANQKVINTDIKAWVGQVAYALGFLFGVLEIVIKRVYEFVKSHEGLVHFLETIAGITAALLVGNLVFGKLISVASSFFNLIKGAATILSSPFSIMALAIGGVIIAVHDMIALFQGKQTWVQSFLEWIGVADQVRDVCFAIFDIISDILNLDFSKLFGDVKGDVAAIGNVFSGIGGKVAGLFGGFGSAEATKNTPASAIAGSGAGGANSNYEVNAPITVNVPAGTDHKAVGQKVQDGVREHLDRVWRETGRSLTGAKAY